MTVTILLEVPVRPDAVNVEEAFEAALPVTASFPGNELAEIIADPSRPHTLFFLTRWTSEADYEAYAVWRSSPAGRTRLSEIVSAPPTVHHFHTHISL